MFLHKDNLTRSNLAGDDKMNLPFLSPTFLYDLVRLDVWRREGVAEKRKRCRSCLCFSFRLHSERKPLDPELCNLGGLHATDTLLSLSRYRDLNIIRPSPSFFPPKDLQALWNLEKRLCPEMPRYCITLRPGSSRGLLKLARKLSPSTALSLLSSWPEISVRVSNQRQEYFCKWTAPLCPEHKQNSRLRLVVFSRLLASCFLTTFSQTITQSQHKLHERDFAGTRLETESQTCCRVVPAQM